MDSISGPLDYETVAVTTLATPLPANHSMFDEQGETNWCIRKFNQKNKVQLFKKVKQ